MVKRFQREHLPLAVIRDRLQALSDAEVEQALAEASAATAAGGADSALDQVRRLLSNDKSVPRALRGQADVFLTTDDELLRKARCKGVLVLPKIANPAQWLIEEVER